MHLIFIITLPARVIKHFKTNFDTFPLAPYNTTRNLRRKEKLLVYNQAAYDITVIMKEITELDVMQRYLQNSKLQNMGLGLFDSWASTFGEVVTSIELAPEGTGYRAKSRFARFYNIPELMNMFKEIADIKTSDQLKLPVPEAEYETVVLKPTEQQKEIVESLGERAEVVRNGGVDASVDNMLKITNDGRKLALDQRLVNELLPDNPESKIAA